VAGKAGKARRGSACFGKVWRGGARQGRTGMVRNGAEWSGWVSRGKARQIFIVERKHIDKGLLTTIF